MYRRPLFLTLALAAACGETPAKTAVANTGSSQAPAQPALRSRAVVRILESPTMDSGEAAMFAKSRASQLAFCYQQYGLPPIPC